MSSTARRALAAPITRPARTTTSPCRGKRRKGGLGYFGFSYFEENQASLEALEIDGGSGLCRAECPERPGRRLRAPRATALRLCETESLGRDGGGGVPRLHARERDHDRRAGAVRAAERDQLDEERQKLDEATGLEHERLGRHAAPAGHKEIDLSPSSRRLGELVVRGVLGAGGADLGGDDGGIVVSLLFPALEFFAEVSPWSSSRETNWAPLFEPASFGVVPLIAATFSVTFWALAVAIPPGSGRRSS